VLADRRPEVAAARPAPGVDPVASRQFAQVLLGAASGNSDRW